MKKLEKQIVHLILLILLLIGINFYLNENLLKCDFLKQRCKNSAAFICYCDRKFIKNIGLKPTWKKLLLNDGFDGRFVKYELY